MPDRQRVGAFDLPFEEARAYWKDRVPMQDREFYALADDAKAKAFTISGMRNLADLERMHQLLGEALDKGWSMEEFRQRAQPIFREAGLGELDPWRARTIFHTNLQSAYMAGKWQQFQETKELLPYLQYVAVGDTRTRPAHRDLSGMVFPVDDPFWDTHYPPNGFNCRCDAVACSESMLTRRWDKMTDEERRRADLSPEALDERRALGEVLLPDPGFGTNVGRSQWGGMARQVLRESDGKWEVAGGSTFLDLGMKTLRQIAETATTPRPPLLKRWSEVTAEAVAGEEAEKTARKYYAAYAEQLLEGQAERVIRDGTGQDVILSDVVFSHLMEHLQGKDQDRLRFLPCLMDTLEHADEVWLTPMRHKERGICRLRKHFIRCYSGKKKYVLVAEYQQGFWVTYTAMPSGDAAHVDRIRCGMLLKARGEK